jgi:hypothetical protein
MSESLFSDHPTWRRQQRGPFYTTIYSEASKVPATERISWVWIWILSASKFLRTIHLDLPCALENFNTHYGTATSGIPKNQPFGPAGFDD